MEQQAPKPDSWISAEIFSDTAEVGAQVDHHGGPDARGDPLRPRVKLQLLDQLKLPRETVFMDVPDCDACWTAIKDMNVRGAPAIAIAAALALAVDLDGAKGSLATAARRVRRSSHEDGPPVHQPPHRGEPRARLCRALKKLAAPPSRIGDGRGRGGHRRVRGHARGRRRSEPRDRRASARTRCAPPSASPRTSPIGVAARHCNTGSLATAGLRHRARRRPRASRDEPPRTHLLQRDAARTTRARGSPRTRSRSRRCPGRSSATRRRRR